MILSTRDLGFRTGGKTLLEGVTLDIASGECLGLIGPNGSGKSTLLRLMAGHLRPTKGEVALEAQPLRHRSSRDIARRLAVVEQQAETAEDLTLRDVVALGRTPWLSPLQPFGPKDEAIVTKVMAQLSLLPLARARWRHLSGGERQRAQIARALAQQPQILLLDEPANHLDIRHQLGLLDIIRGLPVTVVIALHDLNHALGCDRVALLEAGRLATLGPPLEVLTPARIAAVFGVAARYLADPHDPHPHCRFYSHGDPRC